VIGLWVEIDLEASGLRQAAGAGKARRPDLRQIDMGQERHRSARRVAGPDLGIGKGRVAAEMATPGRARAIESRQKHEARA